MYGLTGKTAIVTGAAHGIGKAIAARLLQEGCAVGIFDLDRAAAEATAAELRKGGGNVRVAAGDVSAKADVEAGIGALMGELGPIDILVNNAGIGNHDGSPYPEDLDLNNWRLIQKVNGEGVFLGCRHGIVAMRDHGGAIVNISSIASMEATPHLTAYGFVKAGVEQLSRSVALYCARRGYGIRCNSVHPGIIKTPMLDELVASAAAPEDKMRQKLLKAIPLGVFGEPIDIANGVLYLASDEARHVTGTRLVIDGGITLHG